MGLFALQGFICLMNSSEHKKATNFLGWWQKIANHVYS
ncbi:hypothetical protein [Providencia phage PSTCR7lys]|nr:hypothetical protein [Providencia phage PSTCR7lys]